MNRLSEGAIELNDNEVFNNCSYSCYANIADALNISKAYEDIGFEPEQVKQLNDAFKNSQKKLEKAFDDLLAYKDLEEQGLLIKLPCKVGTDIFRIVNKRIGRGNNRKFNLTIQRGKAQWGDYDKFGKTAFLTREEAEKALKEMEADNENI